MRLIGKRVAVRFSAQAIQDWTDAWPDVPPGDEVVLYMVITNCSRCGGEPTAIGAMDPIGVTEDGELIGEQICSDCIEAEINEGEEE